nr:MAG TPA: hypothetical protein [Caudoviricetes sp.]
MKPSAHKKRGVCYAGKILRVHDVHKRIKICL